MLSTTTLSGNVSWTMWFTLSAKRKIQQIAGQTAETRAVQTRRDRSASQPPSFPSNLPKPAPTCTTINSPGNLWNVVSSPLKPCTNTRRMLLATSDIAGPDGGGCLDEGRRGLSGWVRNRTAEVRFGSMGVRWKRIGCAVIDGVGDGAMSGRWRVGESSRALDGRWPRSGTETSPSRTSPAAKPCPGPRDLKSQQLYSSASIPESATPAINDICM